MYTLPLGKIYPARRGSNVWLRRPKPITVKVGRDRAEREHLEGEWSEALEGFFAQIPLERWMNHPIANACASHKVEQLTRASKFGLAIPPSIVTQSEEELRGFWASCGGQVITKPLASGFLPREFGDDATLIYTSEVTPQHLRHTGTLSACPTLFQKRITKLLDVRVCVIEDDVIGVGLRALGQDGRQRLDVRRNNMTDVIHGQVEIPSTVAAALMALTRSYNLRFAAVDMAIDQGGDWIFFELNPNGQWAWLDLTGVADIASALIASFR